MGPIKRKYWTDNAQAMAGVSSVSSSLLFLVLLFSYGNAQLSQNYYAKSCPRAEAIVKEQVKQLYEKHGNTAVSWLRNLFHDCMVGGCDASLLLETTAAAKSEKTSQRSFGMRNFKYVEVIKAALERECPATVSCADVVVLSARDGVTMLGGPYVDVRTGRRDARASRIDLVNDAIPNHDSDISVVLNRFASIGIDTEHAVALLGAHSVGRVHCLNLVQRLYPTVDPTLDANYAAYLKQRCPTPQPNPEAVAYGRNDRETPMIIDNAYYKHLLQRKGLLVVDQQLASDPRTAPFVEKMAADNGYFIGRFAEALVILSENRPLLGNQGEIRKDCRFANAA